MKIEAFETPGKRRRRTRVRTCEIRDTWQPKIMIILSFATELFPESFETSYNIFFSFFVFMLFYLNFFIRFKKKKNIFCFNSSELEKRKKEMVAKWRDRLIKSIFEILSPMPGFALLNRFPKEGNIFRLNFPIYAARNFFTDEETEKDE